MKNAIYLLLLVALYATFRPHYSHSKLPHSERYNLSNLHSQLSPDGLNLKFTAEGDYCISEKLARLSLIENCQQIIHEELDSAGLSLIRPPSRRWIEKRCFNSSSAQDRFVMESFEVGSEDELAKVYRAKLKVDIMLDDKEINSFRQQKRVVNLWFWLSTILMITGLFHLYFLLDEWTRGYLTQIIIQVIVIPVIILILFKLIIT